MIKASAQASLFPPKAGGRPIIYHRMCVHVIAQEDDKKVFVRWNDGQITYYVAKGPRLSPFDSYGQAMAKFEELRVSAHP